MTQLQTTLRQLRLSGLSQTLDVRLQEAAAGRLGHGEFLELIFQDELNVRHQRMLARRTKAADFRALKTLEDFDWQFNPTIQRKHIFDLVRDFLKDEAFKQQDKTLRRYLKPDLVIIDDMGLKQLPKPSGEYLLEVVMRRYENRSTIMTSNRPLEDWGKLLSDVPTAGAILDRFLHHAITLTITGRSYRIKDSLPAAPETRKAKKPNEPSTAEPAS